MPAQHRRRLNFLLLTALLSGLPAIALAQSDRITGVVRYAGGTPLEAARVTATRAGTGESRTATTDQSGAYTISGLPAGIYTVSASRIGYRRADRANIMVGGEPAVVDFELEPVPLQTVVVTATLREQELADVPFSVAAPTGQQLRERGAETIEDVAANVAGFSVQNLGPGQSQVAIRGASSGQIARDQPGVKEQVGAYLDDAPISLSLFTPDLDLFDVARVEVLRGPQGTLFGAGSLAGTVRYITGQPEIGVRSTFGEIGSSWIGGGSAGANVKLGTNVPLGDRSAGRMVVYHTRMGGYMDAVQPDLSVNNNVNSGRRTGVRAALRFAPTEALIVTPRLVFQRVEMDGWNRIDTFNILANPYTTSRPRVTLGDRKLFTQIEEPFTDDFVLGDVNLKLQIAPGVTLTSITSYTSRDILVVRDAGALTSSITGGSIGLPEEIYTLNSPLDDATKSKVLTQEVRVAGGGDRLRWLGGGFYSTNKRDYGQSLLVAGFQAGTDIPTEGLRAPRDVLFYSDLAYDLKQFALFGELTVPLLDRIEFTGGVRYYNFDEEREQVFDGIFAHDNTGTQIVSVPGSTGSSGFAPRLIASMRATDWLTVNAQASRGIRLGGINDPLNVPLCTPEDLETFSGRDSWEDETAWNYEIGTKAQMLNGRASINLSGFYMDIRDLQLIVTAGSCSSRLVFNVPKSVSQGLEAEVAVAPNEFVDFAVSATYNNSQVRSTLISVNSAGDSSVVSGIQEFNRLPSVPKIQAAAAVSVRRPLRTGAQGFVTATLHHIGSRYTQIDDLAAGFGTVDMTSFEASGGETIGGPLTQTTFRFDPLLPAYTLANLRVGMSRANWETALFINNVLDERAFLALDRERGTRARVGYLTNQPRTFGVTFGFHY